MSMALMNPRGFSEPVHDLFMPGCKSRFCRFFLLTYVKYAARKNLKNHDFRRDLKKS
jgi:hypothetical protein